MNDYSILLSDLLEENEDFELELKAAQGRNGRGEVPGSIWESYSAMANTEGGVILLGVEDDVHSQHKVLGLKDVERVRKSVWDSLNNKQQVSSNLLLEKDVAVVEREGLNVLMIRVPRATRLQRPVYIGANPLTGTYRRNFEGDYKCDEETVRRMLAEAVEDIRDSKIVVGFDMDDLDLHSLASYRNEMKSTSPNHPWLALGDLEFLRSLGAWGQDRNTRKSGLTLAGILMFGRLPSILDAVPHYVVDYQERSAISPEKRWLDRVTTDGTWSGNLFDFYRRVYPKLTSGLKVPFRLLHGNKRVDENHVHEALREAFVNTLIHADFTDRISVLIVKRDDYFGFRNPGGLRLPVETVLRGGESDCRNRRLQKMFQLIGAAEQAGSGFPKILRAWKVQHWRFPLLDEKYQPEQTVLRLPMTSLLPPETIAELVQLFGEKFQELNEIERLAVVTAQIEGKVTNKRLRSITDFQSRDLTSVFKSLVVSGFLTPDGSGTGTCYRLPGWNLLDPRIGVHGVNDSLFNQIELTMPIEPSSTHLPSDSEHLPSDSTHLPPDSTHLDFNSEHLDVNSEHLDVNSEHLLFDSIQYQKLASIAIDVSSAKKASASQVRSTILLLCNETDLTLDNLSRILKRTPLTLRMHYLSAMIKSGLLQYRFPQTVNHPNQAYRTVKR